MYTSRSFELPNYLKPYLEKAKKLEWLTIVFLCSVIVLMYLTMGSSQAMKTAWLEDALSLIPSIVFLISTKIYDKEPSKKFPYGYHRVFSIAFLTGAVALLAIGLFLIVDSSMTLIMGEHPTIGTIFIYGHQIWMGWIMILVLIYSAVPPVILGHKKMPIAKKLHNKILYTAADTQKADYMTAGAAILGILGIGLGYWWADSVMAIIISLSVINDGYKNMKNAVLDLMDRVPHDVTHQEVDPLMDEINNIIRNWNWISDYEARFREHGQVYFGEIKVIPNVPNIENHITIAIEELKNHHWKLFDVTIMPVQSLDD